MKCFSREAIDKDVLPGRVIQRAIGNNSFSRSQIMTVGFAHYSAEAGPMEPHQHAEEAIYVTGAKDGWVEYGPQKDNLETKVALTSGMVICPCSGRTLSAVAAGASTNLIHRAADVHLKERRRLILVPRETPLSLIHLDNMRRALQAGAVILPAMPAWYQGVASVSDLVDFVVARILDQLQIPHALSPRWGDDR